MGRSSPSDHSKNAIVGILTPLPPEEMTTFTKDVLPTVISQTKKAWLQVIPPEAEPPQSEKGRVCIEFDLHSDGKIKNMKLVSPSGKIALDRAAWGALTGAQPFPPFPPKLKTETIRLQLCFSYNLNADQPVGAAPQKESNTPTPVN